MQPTRAVFLPGSGIKRIPLAVRPGCGGVGNASSTGTVAVTAQNPPVLISARYHVDAALVW